MKTEINNKRKYIVIGIIILIIIAIALFFIFHHKSQNNHEITKEKVTPIIYEVTKNGNNNKIYLFGSIHVANTNKMIFPQYVIDAYNNSHYLACEFDLVEYQKNNDKALEAVAMMTYTDNTTIKNHLSKETYNKLVDFLKQKQMYSEIYDIYKPSFFESLITGLIINDSKISATNGVDTYFIQKAKEDHKKILEIETSDYQIDLLLNFDDKLYDIILNELIDNYNDEVESLKNLYESWKTGNIDNIVDISNEELKIKENYTKEQIELINNYNKTLIDDRNISMTNKLIEYFNNSYDTFYMIGAAHLIGDNGIVKLLIDKGYNVTPLK